MTDKKKKPKKKKIEGYEVFEIKKNSNKKEKEKVLPKKEEPKKISKKQEKEQERILYYFLIGFAVFMILILLFFFIANFSRTFTYKNIKFNIIKKGNIFFYNSHFKTILNNKLVDYNIYLRNDPRILDKIPFNGKPYFSKIMVLNFSNSINCGGYGNIAIANLGQIFNAMGTKVITDPNATCDSKNRYLFVKIQNTNKTSVDQLTKTCYSINVKNCEILKATEKFILEYYVDYYSKTQK